MVRKVFSKTLSWTFLWSDDTRLGLTRLRVPPFRTAQHVHGILSAAPALARVETVSEADCISRAARPVLLQPSFAVLVTPVFLCSQPLLSCAHNPSFPVLATPIFLCTLRARAHQHRSRPEEGRGSESDAHATHARHNHVRTRARAHTHTHTHTHCRACLRVRACTCVCTIRARARECGLHGSPP